MSYSQLDKQYDDLTRNGMAVREFHAQISQYYAAHMNDFQPIVMPVAPSGSPSCSLLLAGAPSIRRTLTPPVFRNFGRGRWIEWDRELLDCWVSQFVKTGYSPMNGSSVYPGAFAPGPLYGNAFSQLQSITKKISGEFSVRNRKFSHWAREHERVFFQNIGYVQFTGTWGGCTYVYKIGMRYAGA